MHGPVPRLAGYDEGAWWVQDAAAALPAQLLGDVRGKSVADLCAAPGGKTAQLAAAGARVTAVDRSASRLERLKQNLARLNLAADTVIADVTEWQSEPFDAVLLDAPCSATGTIRRHPDIPWLKRESDIATLAALQRRLLARAVELTRPGGLIVYCTCSLEPDEGVDAGDRAAGARFSRPPPPGCGERASGLARTSWTPPATCAPCPANCLIPGHKWAASTASMPAGSSVFNRTVGWPPSRRSGMVRPAGPMARPQ